VKISIVLAFAVLTELLVATVARSEDQTRPPLQAQPLAHTYRGAFVCEKQPAAADILHVPADLAIRGDQVQFGRPMFNRDGTRVLGSELGLGSVDGRGAVNIASSWSFRGISIRGVYEGTLTPGGGTLTGTQTWQGADGARRSRTCQIALVPGST
jgi:hypothetical protein